jgi:hypothetical protein
VLFTLLKNNILKGIFLLLLEQKIHGSKKNKHDFESITSLSAFTIKYHERFDSTILVKVTKKEAIRENKKLSSASI